MYVITALNTCYYNKVKITDNFLKIYLVNSVLSYIKESIRYLEKSMWNNFIIFNFTSIFEVFKLISKFLPIL